MLAVMPYLNNCRERGRHLVHPSGEKAAGLPLPLGPAPRAPPEHWAPLGLLWLYSETFLDDGIQLAWISSKLLKILEVYKS